MYAEHFSINNIPYGVASSNAHPKKTVATRFEDNVIFLDELAKFDSSIASQIAETLDQETVNAFAALSKAEQQTTRKWIQGHLKKLETIPASAITPIADATLHLPISVGDFTDFSCSAEHNRNAGRAVWNDPTLPRGFEHFPGGYHGRSSSIVVSGTPVLRPKGQFLTKEDTVEYGPTKRLDYELEVGTIIGKTSTIGQPVDIKDADDYIFGLVLLNDWSARDIQALEMRPLGPLNGKSFSTSISPWIITLDALASARVPAPKRNPDIEMAPYLQDPDPKPTFDIALEASLKPAGASTSSLICKSDFSSIYWTLRDLVAHQTVNGCNIRTGDILATGTISGTTSDSHGCLMEIAPKGGLDIMVDGKSKKVLFLEDGDTVSLTATAGEGVGFGNVSERCCLRFKSLWLEGRHN